MKQYDFTSQDMDTLTKAMLVRQKWAVVGFVFFFSFFLSI